MPAGKKKLNGRAPAIDPDDSEDGAVENLVEEVMQSADSENENEDVVVNLEDEDDETEEPPAPGAPGSRDEKKKSNWARLRESERAANERAAQLDRDLAAERARAQTLAEVARQQPPPGRQPPAPDEDPSIAEEKRIVDEMRAAQDDWRAIVATHKDGVPAEVAKRFHDKWEDLDAKRVDLRVSRGVRRAILEERSRASQGAVTPQGQAAINYVYQNFPELAQNEAAMVHANSLLQADTAERFHRTGRAEPPTIQMLDAALKETRRRFGTASPPAPTTAVRAKFSGLASGQRATNGTNGAPKTATLGPNERRMARARWPKLAEKDAFRRFAREMADEET